MDESGRLKAVAGSLVLQTRSRHSAQFVVHQRYQLIDGRTVTRAALPKQLREICSVR